jgi:hypothetical protein
MMLSELVNFVSRVWTPPAMLPGMLTMVIPALRDIRDGRQAEKVAAQCRDCARLLAVNLFVWRKSFPEKASLKMWNKDTMSFIGMTLEDFQNFLMANFTLKTSDRKEWLCDKVIADRIWQACTATDSPLPVASWQTETDRKRKAAR